MSAVLQRTHLASLAIGVGVYTTTLIGSLPLEALVRQQVTVLEEQTGVRLAFDAGSYHLWKVELSNATITTPAGRHAGTLPAAARQPR